MPLTSSGSRRTDAFPDIVMLRALHIFFIVLSKAMQTGHKQLRATHDIVYYLIFSVVQLDHRTVVTTVSF